MVAMRGGARRAEADEHRSAPPRSATSADFVRHFGTWQDRANEAPIFVTHHGRARHVLISISTFQEMLGARDAPADDAVAALRLSTLIHAIDLVFVAVDRNASVVAMNPAAGGFFRVSSQQAIGVVAARLIPEFDGSLLATHAARTIASGDCAAFDMPSTSRPGEWLRCAVFPYGNGAGCLLRVVTGERRALVASADSQAMHEALAAIGSIGRGRLSLRGTFVDVDPILARLAGFPAADLDQVRLVDILPLNRRVEAVGFVETVLAAGRPAGFDTVLMHKLGGETAVRIGLAPLVDDQGVAGASIVVSQQGTPRTPSR